MQSFKRNIYAVTHKHTFPEYKGYSAVEFFKNLSIDVLCHQPFELLKRLLMIFLMVYL
jgi:hypothetical protein